MQFSYNVLLLLTYYVESDRHSVLHVLVLSQPSHYY